MHSRVDFREIILYGSILLVALRIIWKVVFVRRLPLPPGPKGLPIIGNIFDLPPPGIPEWHHWLKHKKLYGPLSSVTVFNQTIVLLHDKDVAFELLDKQSAKFSSRPSMMFASEMCGYKRGMALLPYNKTHRQYRKLVAEQIGSTTSIVKFEPSIDLQVRRFLFRTMNNPEDLVINLESSASSLMLDMVYGYNPNSNSRDPLVLLVNQVMSEFSEATVAGAWLVDLIPWLQYLPEWVPGTGFKEIARRYHKTFIDVTNIPFNFTEKQRAHGANKLSFVSGILDRSPNMDERENLKYSALSLYSGGADTSAAALGFFFLAMTLFPEVQSKAREEIDRIVGDGRLPGFKDRANLPYVEAIVKETLRWVPIVPLCLPHTADEEYEFRGYRIPKGSIILPSISWFSQDPNIYHEPHLFKPERFFGPGKEPSPNKFTFGFGRRVCPGRHLADASLFLTIVQSLAVFEIMKPADQNIGRDTDPTVISTPGLIAHAKRFHYIITPRSEKHKELVNAVNTEHVCDEDDSKLLEGLGG